MNHPLSAVLLAVLACPLWAAAQSPLTLDEAVRRAANNNPGVKAAKASEAEAGSRVDEARAVWFPKIDLSESIQRGNQPVFVFGSLLGQRHFAAENFAIDALNHPDAITNVRTAVGVEQAVFDLGRMTSGIRAARLGAEMAGWGTRDVAQALKVAATHAYGRVLMAQARGRAAAAAVAAAAEDVARVEHRRDAGLATEGDVLGLRVHLSHMRQGAIEAAGQESVARAELNDVMGDPIDTTFQLEEPRPPVADDRGVHPETDTASLTRRTDVARATLASQLATVQIAASRAAMLPQAAVQGVYEFNGQSFGSQASSWTVGAVVRWNLFAGMADAARARAARAALDRANAEREQVESHARVELRSAQTRFETARARWEVAQGTRAQAQESQRIIRDRYDAGLAPVNDVLRAATAVLDSNVAYTTALVDLFISRALIERAQGQ
ncbi:MAG: TolC family protein [Acidobacteriota bacterium]